MTEESQPKISDFNSKWFKIKNSLEKTVFADTSSGLSFAI